MKHHLKSNSNVESYCRTELHLAVDVHKTCDEHREEDKLGPTVALSLSFLPHNSLPRVGADIYKIVNSIHFLQFYDTHRA